MLLVAGPAHGDEGALVDPLKRGHRFRPRVGLLARPLREILGLMVVVYYRDELSPPAEAHPVSSSPTKPRRFMTFLRETPLFAHLKVVDDFDPIRREDLLLAHEEGYVDAFLHGRKPLCESSELDWSPGLRDSVLYTNGALLAAIRGSVEHPHIPTLAPVSGFHHARPAAGSGFCTFSGQVIAALKMYHWRGLTGAWVDLDGHFGNSIEDSRAFCPDLDHAVPRQFHINPEGSHDTYLHNLKRSIESLRRALLSAEVDYLCFAHGADSHEWDQLGMQCTTEEWLQASRLVYSMICEVQWERPLPVTMVHFGGYRDDHPESVLGLHSMDLAVCLENLMGEHVAYQAEVRAPA